MNIHAWRRVQSLQLRIEDAKKELSKRIEKSDGRGNYIATKLEDSPSVQSQINKALVDQLTKWGWEVIAVPVDRQVAIGWVLPKESWDDDE